MLHIHRSRPQNTRMGWIPDIPDSRDYPFKALMPKKLKSLPREVDLRDRATPVEDQGNIGSCVANAVVGCMEYLDNIDGDGEWADWARLFLYYNAREMKGWQNTDSGCYIRDAVKSAATVGVCLEKTDPYITTNFDVKPSPKAYEEAKDHLITAYFRMLTVLEMQANLAEDRPSVFGIPLYDSFFRVGKDGEVPMPKRGERMHGGHAMALFGYRSDERFIIRNSWNVTWGDRGYGYLPFEYIERMGSDFWAIIKAKV
jgi:C1A family cysteine protease